LTINIHPGEIRLARKEPGAGAGKILEEKQEKERKHAYQQGLKMLRDRESSCSKKSSGIRSF
jgi:hypothetical protein